MSNTKTCASCGLPRGNKKDGWNFHLKDGVAIAVTCPNCPEVSESITRITSRGEAKFQARADITPPGAVKRKQTQRTFRTLGQARAWLAEVRDGSSRPGWVDPSQFTVRQICEKWIDARRAEIGTPGGAREETINGYASARHALLMHMGDRVARDVTPGEIEAALRHLATKGGKWKRPLSHNSVKAALGRLRQAYAYAVRERWLAYNPANDARTPRKEAGTGEKKMLRWNPTQLAAFRNHVDTYADGAQFEAQPWVRAGMRLTLCGLRRSEVLGLDWKNVDLETGIVKVRQARVKTQRGNATKIEPVKTDASRRDVKAEEIFPGTLAALRALWLKQGRPADGLAICDANGQPVHPGLYSDRFRRLCDDAEIPRLARVHNVRHSIATMLKENGTSENKAAALLGHDVATYQRFYLPTDDEAAAEAAKALGALFANL